MSYDNSKSAPSSNTRGRAARAEEKKDKDKGAGLEGSDSPNNIGGQPGSVAVAKREHGGGGGAAAAGGGTRSSSPSGASGSRGSSGDQRGPTSDDTDGLSSGNDSGERESETGMERENRSHGHQSMGSSHSSSNGKDSAMMLSNKSSNSQSLSPPSGSLAYSLLSTSSERDPPSTSGCSSDQSARVQTQKELMKALKELKIRLPAERRGKSHSSTLDALKYALNCVKQVRANQEYYHQWSVEECQGCSLDLSTFTLEELDNITSEYTLKNTDTFSMAVSFLTGKVVYISPQGSYLLRCKPERLQGTIFSELLAPQDVSTFYSGTAPCRLPVWATCIGSVSPPMDCTQEKSMFCRISADRAQGSDLRYYPFRLTPYQLTIRDSDAAEPQPCCLLIAEKVHSGYEAPRIPPDKRIFTTSHSPSCVFQEVDERAVPLLGYLPQDLVGTPILLYLHPEDRPVMVAIHKKILQFAGQPFDHSPLRMCARNGEYLTIDTSWSSFVNPWSRKVAFIVGRHKVRTSPLNEDVFTTGCENRVTTPKIAELSEQIHRLLVQPVHSNSSQGYSSLGSNGSRGSRCSHQQHLSASSSESNSPTMEDAMAAVTSHKPMTFQQICKDVHMVKTNGQQVFIESRNRPPLRKHANTGTANGLRAITNDPIRAQPDMPCPPKDLIPALLVPKESSTGYSYQQINCLDSIIRYLESCNIPNTVKRKCGSSSGTSTSDDDKQQESSGTNKGAPVSLGREPSPLPPLMASKAESEVSVTSLCSFSSTIVHVGDKKPPESDIVMEDAPQTPTQAPTTAAAAAVTPAPPPPPPPPPQSPSSAAKPERDGGWRCAAAAAGTAGGGGASSRLGLTKEVLSAHTQQEEQAFLDRFKDLSKLRVFDPTASSTVRCQTTPSNPLARGARCSRDYPGARGAGGGGSSAGGGGHRRSRACKRLKHQETSDQHSSMGLSSSLDASAGVHSSSQQPLPLAGVGCGAPGTTSSSWPASVGSQASMPSVPIPTGMLPMYPIYPPLSQHMQIPDPTRFPMMVVLPNYMFPQMAGPMAQPLVQPLVQPGAPHPGHFFNPNFPYAGPAMPTLTPMPPVVAQPVVPIPAVGGGAATATNAAQSRCSTPGSGYRTADGAESPLFQSRCSSPLNLVQLDEAPTTTALAAAAQQAAAVAQQAAAAASSAGQGASGAGGQSLANQRSTADASKENENGEANESNNDAMSTSSDLLDLLLQEDSRSGTGSAASGSGSSGTGSSGSGSGSNGCSSSGTSGTRSSQSSHTSKYFGSIDSSENDHSRKQPAGGSVSTGGSGGDSGEEQFIKCVLQDPIWLLMANTDDKVMMTYQLPVRDVEAVLRKDREALRNMQKHQPRFTEEQKKELSQVHPWIRTGRLPRTINVSACTGCKSPTTAAAPAAPFDVEIHEMELCSVLDSNNPEAKKTAPASSSDAAMDESHGHEEEEEEEEEVGGDGDGGKGPKRQSGDQEMSPEDREVQEEEEEGEATSSPADDGAAETEAAGGGDDKGTRDAR